MRNQWLCRRVLIVLLLAMLSASCWRAAGPAATSTRAAVLPTATPHSTATPTSTPAPPMVSAAIPGTELLALLTPLLPREVSVMQSTFDQANPGAVLLVPTGMAPEQTALAFTDQDGKSIKPREPAETTQSSAASHPRGSP